MIDKLLNEQFVIKFYSDNFYYKIQYAYEQLTDKQHIWRFYLL